jgi:putative intracellular protease/amidase
MPSSLPRRALIAVTSATAPLHGPDKMTGLFITEALHPYNVLRAAGFEVDLASETGKYVPDWLAQQPDFLNGEDLATWNDVNSEFRRKLDSMPKASDLLASGVKYGVFFASAGHAALLDFPTARNLQAMAEQVWADGGIVASVCHGPAIFADVKDTATGEPIIKGKTINGFTTQAEIDMSIMHVLQTWGQELVEDMAARLGATCSFPPLLFNFPLPRLDYPGDAPKIVSRLTVSPTDKRSEGVWDDFHVADGRLITGQNPQSATSTAKAVVDAFDAL